MIMTADSAACKPIEQDKRGQIINGWVHFISPSQSVDVSASCFHAALRTEELPLLIGAVEMFSIARVIVSVDAWRLERLLVSQAR